MYFKSSYKIPSCLCINFVQSWEVKAKSLIRSQHGDWRGIREDSCLRQRWCFYRDFLCSLLQLTYLGAPRRNSAWLREPRTACSLSVSFNMESTQQQQPLLSEEGDTPKVTPASEAQNAVKSPANNNTMAQTNSDSGRQTKIPVNVPSALNMSIRYNRIFKKVSQDGNLVLFLPQRELMVTENKVESLMGIALIHESVVKAPDTKVYLHIVLIFR